MNNQKKGVNPSLKAATEFTYKLSRVPCPGSSAHHVFPVYLDVLNSFSQGLMAPSEVHDRVKFLLANFPDLWAEFESLFIHQTASTTTNSSDQKRKRNRRIIYESEDGNPRVRVSEELTCTPSYRILPPEDRCTATEDPIAREVLNTRCAIGIAASGSKPRKYTAEQEFMNRFEDERYKLNMTLARIQSALQTLRPCQEIVADRIPDLNATPVNINDRLTPVTLRCIESMYGSRMNEVQELLLTSPDSFLPKLIARLEGKENEILNILHNVLKLTN